ncbi:cell division protein FtsW, partial [Lactobacillaceae bacterium KNUT 0156]|nr:cell division protein FtsW [Weissella cibaria]
MQKINARRGSLSVFWREVLKMIVKQVKYMDIQMLIAIVALMVFGTGMVFTSSTNMASGSALSFFGKQVLFAIIA